MKKRPHLKERRRKQAHHTPPFSHTKRTHNPPKGMGINDKNRWGDEDDEDGVLPEPVETPEDAKGFKTRTEYKINEFDEKVKVVKKIRVIRTEMKVAKRVEERRQRMKPFGRALDGVKDLTYQDINEVKMLSPKEADSEEGGQAVDMNKAFDNFRKKQQMRLFHQQADSQFRTVGAEDEQGAGEDGQGQGGAGGSHYVPPSQRGAGGPSGLARLQAVEPEHKIIRVSNLSDNTKEDDLATLFQPFGHIHRIYLAKDKETGRSRGFAFVTFANRPDAERAMETLQGYGYDHLILKLEWAKPSNKDPAAQASSFRSGYGKALAQDTTQRVSYASNLTTGTAR